GAGIEGQIKALRHGTHIVVATPGRLLDLMNRGIADVSSIRFLVLDEADIMLNMGFKEELDAILKSVPEERQTILLSATMPEEVAEIASNYMCRPEEITIGRKNTGIATVEHNYFIVHAKEKYLALKRIVDFHPDMYAIIFCRTRSATQEIADKMIKDGYNAEALHGDLSQVQREFVMRKFRERSFQLLIATDIAARGLDVSNLTHVIHYDLPDEIEVYTHRSGRTGRAGKNGISLAVINMKEKYRIKQIERVIQRAITEAKVPNGKDICEQQLMRLIDRVKSVKVDTDQISPYMPIIEEKLAALNREELLKHFVSLEFNRFLQYYKNTPDLKPVVREVETSKFARKERDRNYRDKRSRERSDVGRNDFTYLIINLGKKDKVLPPQIIGLINQSTRNRHIRIGKIDIGSAASRVQVESSFAGHVYSTLKGYNFLGRKLLVEKEDYSSPSLKARRAPLIRRSPLASASR
ncbi:MAG: DEAD/DEAH box helicase, partial [Spirochaetota bacterium]